MNTKNRKSVAVAVAAGGIAAATSLGFVGLASATASNLAGTSSPLATSTQDPTVNSDTPGGPRGPGGPGGPGGPRGPGGQHGPGGPGGPQGELLHGESVVKDSDGVKTIDMQQGKVTEVSATSITVKSSDDFVATYTVNGDTKVGKDGKESAIAEVKVGDTVHLNGTKTDGSLTANFIMDGKPPALLAQSGNGNQSKPTVPSPSTTTG